MLMFLCLFELYNQIDIHNLSVTYNPGCFHECVLTSELEQVANQGIFSFLFAGVSCFTRISLAIVMAITIAVALLVSKTAIIGLLIGLLLGMAGLPQRPLYREKISIHQSNEPQKYGGYAEEVDEKEDHSGHCKQTESAIAIDNINGSYGGAVDSVNIATIHEVCADPEIE